MVRAAAAGVIDYTQADPKDINWRLRHRLLIEEMERKDDVLLLEATHRHWMGYFARPISDPKVLGVVVDSANNALDSLRQVVAPWYNAGPPAQPAADKPAEAGTISAEHAELIERYKKMTSQKET